MLISSYTCFAVALVTVALSGPLSLVLFQADRGGVAPAMTGPPPMLGTNQAKRPSLENHNIPLTLAYSYLLADLLESDEPQRVKELLDPVLPELVTMVWINREKFSYTRLVLEDWWSKQPLDVRSVYALGGLEPSSLVTWLKEKEQTMGSDRFTVVEDKSLLPAFASIIKALDEVRTPYFVLIHADTTLEPLTVHYFLRRALLNPEAAIINPTIWELHPDNPMLYLHGTYEFLSATKTPVHSGTVPFYIRLPREHGVIPAPNGSTSVRDLTRKYINTQPLTAMGVEFHCALFETKVARHRFGIIDPYATENPLNSAFVAAELNRNIMVEPQAIAIHFFPRDGCAFEQEDIFMMAWAWGAEMAYVNNCYPESKFGHIAESPRIRFWMDMVGNRMKGAHYGWNSPEPIHPDPEVQAQMVIGMLLIIGPNRFQLQDTPGEGAWLEPRKFYTEATAAAERGEPGQIAFLQEKTLAIPRWNGPKLEKWLQRVAIHEKLNDDQHLGFVLPKGVWPVVEGYDCGHQVYREHYFLRLVFAGEGAEPQELACVSSLPSSITDRAFLILGSPQNTQFKLELWFEFPAKEDHHYFQVTVTPEAHLGGKNCDFIVADDNPKTISLPTAANGVHLLQWKHNINYTKYFQQLAVHNMYPFK
ncbi:hypothetical protein QOT17_002354 [Balamuthia mandrillaris]